MIQAHDDVKSEFATETSLAISLLKLHASGFAPNLKRDDIRVNPKDYVVLLTVDESEKRRPLFRLAE